MEGKAQRGRTDGGVLKKAKNPKEVGAKKGKKNHTRLCRAGKKERKGSNKTAKVGGTEKKKRGRQGPEKTKNHNPTENCQTEKKKKCQPQNEKMTG